MKHLLTILVAVVASLLAVYTFGPKGGEGAAPRETAYERVMRTGVLRCGYGVAPPWMYVDVNSGEVKGVMADIARDMAESLELKLEWVETDWGQIAISLQSSKIDAMCAGLWSAPVRGKHMLFTRPFAYSFIVPIIRVGDHRFDKGLAALNDPNITIAINDGDMSDIAARRYFPQAKRQSVISLGTTGDDRLFVDVAEGKADVTLSTPDIMGTFEKANPEKLRGLTEFGPVETFGNVFAVASGEMDLLYMLDNGLNQLLLNGRIQDVLKRSGLLAMSFRLPNPPFNW